MLIADDVGLGKTIEAGLILWPLLSKETVRRVLILCPSSLTGQWQYRLRTMFDLRFQIYQTQLDTPRSEYWEINHQVIASLHTLRDDKDNRHQRLIESQKWDLVIVDEAHHVYHDQKTGKTKAFMLLEKLTQLQRVRSLVFFTGTPHRGRDFGFLSLLGLLREDLFPNPKESLEQCIPRIRQVMIRNNKTNVTDLRGEKLFLTPKVKVLPYQYSPEEQRFYDLLTEFIITGKAWAANLQDQQRQAVMLVLIAIQKLASSSVAAVRRALKRRLAGIEHRVTNLKKKMNARDTLQILLDLDPADTSVVEELNQIEEQIDLAAFELSLNSDEIPRLRELVAVADLVQSETKLEAIVHLTEQMNNEPILFFTEYKATQSQLLSLLAKRFGETNITFINGDERADDVQGSSWRITREQAADKFNSGQARFLVSTEAGGEGIDLQERCHILIHVDLPWNPMRLQQRVGRINRYGQKKQVEVYSFRNPDTVESRIWSTLEEKINRIQVAHAGGMDEPEDLYQLILGMTNPHFFQELFANGVLQSHERLSSWFDQKTATFGGTDVVKTVQGLLGSVDRFDFQTVGKSIPRLDLPDLKSFILNTLRANRRLVQDTPDGLSFKTPESWVEHIGVRENYENMVFDRSVKSADANQRVLAIGHPVLKLALKQAQKFDAVACQIRDNHRYRLYFFSIQDRITEQQSLVKRKLVGVKVPENNPKNIEVLNDEASLILLNELSGKISKRPIGEDFQKLMDISEVSIVKQRIEQEILSDLEGFKYPESSLIASILVG